MSTLNGTVTLHGLELDVFSECEVRWEDDSFDHEFGTEHCGHAEVDTIESVELDGDLRASAMCDLGLRNVAFNRRKFIKWLRRIRRALAKLDPETFWTKRQLDAVVENWEPPEPDYDPPDREPGVSSFSFD